MENEISLEFEQLFKYYKLNISPDLKENIRTLMNHLKKITNEEEKEIVTTICRLYLNKFNEEEVAQGKSNKDAFMFINQLVVSLISEEPEKVLNCLNTLNSYPNIKCCPLKKFQLLFLIGQNEKEYKIDNLQELFELIFIPSKFSQYFNEVNKKFLLVSNPILINWNKQEDCETFLRQLGKHCEKAYKVQPFHESTDERLLQEGANDPKAKDITKKTKN